MKDVYVVAHTESKHHVEDVVGGWHDTGLTELGRRQADRVAAELAERLSGTPADDIALVSSDLKRTVETAQPIARRLGLTLRTSTGLREMNFGSAGGQPQSWMREHETFAPEHNRLDHRGGIDDAETRRELATRIYQDLEEIAAAPEPTQVIVTHGFAATFVIACWIRMPIESLGWVNFKMSTGGIAHLAEDDVRRNRTVVALNQVEHLREPR